MIRPGPKKKQMSSRQNFSEQLKVEDQKLTTLIGPAPCFFTKLDGKFRWQIVLRGADLAAAAARATSHRLAG